MTGLVLLGSALCGLGFGYAAQRGSICVVAGIEAWLATGSPRLLVALLRCSLWVVAVATPLVWLDRDAHLAPLYAPGLLALGGGLAFGVGAAINGGCSFGTLIRLGAGDLSFAGTLLGMAAGFALQSRLGPAGPSPAGPSPLETPTALAVPVLALALLFVTREAVRLRAEPVRRGRWSPERAVAVMGVSGGLLYALQGSWAWTVALQRSVDAMATAQPLARPLVLIFACSVLGAAWGAARRRRMQPRLALRRWPLRIAGGLVMGLGAAYVPGGNDALVLHGAPGLSLHVLIASPALVAGAAGALAIGRGWRRIATPPPPVQAD